MLHEVGDADGGRPADAGDAVHHALHLVLVRLVNQLGRFLCEDESATLVNFGYLRNNTKHQNSPENTASGSVQEYL